MPAHLQSGPALSPAPSQPLLLSSFCCLRLLIGQQSVACDQDQCLMVAFKGLPECSPGPGHTAPEHRRTSRQGTTFTHLRTSSLLQVHLEEEDENPTQEAPVLPARAPPISGHLPPTEQSPSSPRSALPLPWSVCGGMSRGRVLWPGSGGEGTVSQGTYSGPSCDFPKALQINSPKPTPSAPPSTALRHLSTVTQH